MCDLYGPLNQLLLVADATLTGSHYKMDIINGVGHLRSDSVVPLVLCTVVCNGWGTNIVLQVPWDSANLPEKG
jgi:hypothetical protein